MNARGLCQRKFQKNSSSGFSFVEVLTAIAISSVVALAGAFVVSNAWAWQYEYMAVNQIQLFRGQLLENLSRDDAWNKTIELGSAGGIYSSGKFDCLKNGTPCTVDGTAGGAPLEDQLFAVVDQMGKVGFDATRPSSGFNAQGTLCDSFSPTANNSVCQFRYELRWSAICIRGSCINPQIKVRALLQRSSESSAVLNLMNYSIAEIYWTPPPRTVGNPMIMTWKTDNVSSGSSATNQVLLPLVAGSSYDFVVEWGDGSTDTINSWNATNKLHSYAASGTYTIRLTGRFDRLSFANAGDRLKILDVTAWGDNKWTSMAHAFSGCANLAISASDAPDLSGVADMSYMFHKASSFNSNIGHWKTSSVTDMSYMFAGDDSFSASMAFNQNIGSWDTSRVTNMSHMFSVATAFNQNIGNWNTSAVKDMSSMFERARVFNQNIGRWDTSAVTDMSGMFKSDPWLQFEMAFNQNIGSWNTSAVTDMSLMFSRATAFNQNIGGWNTSAVTDMSGMFSGATVFNQNIGGWDTSTVTDMSSMFGVTAAFNQYIGGWNTSAVTTMQAMFSSATAFNQNIGGWDTSSVKNMNWMFFEARSFNQNIGGWNTSRVVDMSFMFRRALAFNQNIGSWDTSNVADMSFMFGEASSFNQNISGWNTSRVKSMSSMFYVAPKFNQNIGSWDTSNVTDMSYMFRAAPAFNQNISGWNTSRVKNIAGIFHLASSFNQDLSGWNVAAVTQYSNYRLGANAWTLPKPLSLP